MAEVITITEADLEAVNIAEGSDNEHYFVKPLESYERDFSLRQDYIDISVGILTRELGITKELATELEKEIYNDMIATGEAHMPDLYFWHKDPITQDRDLSVMPLDVYIETAIEEKLRIAPTMTCYWSEDSPGIDRKIIPYESNWVFNNVKVRAAIKKEGLEALACGNYDRYEQLNPFQLAKKMGNNSLSGLESLKYLPIYTMSGHNSLTGPTRIITSLGNLYLERAVGGNRYYRNINETMMEWELSILKIDHAVVKQTIEWYGLKYPTAEDLYELAYKGGKWQYNVIGNKAKIIKYANSLTPLERACVAYNVDMFTLYKLNPDIIGKFIYDSSQQVTGITNDLSIITDGRIKNAVHHILIDKLAGKGVDYENIAEKEPELAWYLASTYVNFSRVIHRYNGILNTFFRDTDMFPTHISDSKRLIKVVVKLSDTDSTCDSKHYFATVGDKTKYRYTDTGIARAAVITWVTSGAIDAKLKQFAKNMGVETSKLNILSVKPEVTWSTFIPAKSAKHYTNCAILEEYIALPHVEYSSSGVGLIAGQMSPKFKSLYEDLKKEYHDLVNGGVELSAKDLDAFNQMLYSILYRETILSPETLLKSARIKQPEMYSQPAHQSNYAGLWAYQDIFGGNYPTGLPAPTPIRVVPINTSDKKKMDSFLLQLEASGDKISIDVAKNWRKWLKDTGRTHITTIKIPMDVTDIDNWKIPKELLSILDTKRLIKGVYNQFRYFGKTLGAYGSGKKYDITTTQRTLGLQELELPEEHNVTKDIDGLTMVGYRTAKKYL